MKFTLSFHAFYFPANKPKTHGARSSRISLDKVKFYESILEDPYRNDYEPSETSSSLPYDLLIWIVVNEKNSGNSTVFEIHMLIEDCSSKPEIKYRLRIEKFKRDSKKAFEPSVKTAYSNDGLVIIELYKQSLKPFLNDKLFEFSRDLSSPLAGSKLLQAVSF